MDKWDLLARDVDRIREGRRPTIEPYIPTRTERPWITEVLVAHGPGYIGKVLYYTPGHTPVLQYHREKDETFYLLSGECWVHYDAGDGVLRRVRMTPGESYHVPPGAVHRVVAITDCVMVEASSPVFEDRVNVEAEYE